MNQNNYVYAGFWIRTAASLIDTICMMIITVPLLWFIYGSAYFDPDKTGFVAGWADVVISHIAPAIAVIGFWFLKKGTPGKLLFAMEVLDEDTGDKLTLWQSVVRYLCYFVSIIPLMLGIIWIGIDRKKQGWHDKLANTVVIRRKDTRV